MTKISKRQADLIETRVDDELIVVSLANGEFYSLRDTALAIWNAINDVRSPEDLTRYLLPLFDAPEATVQADVAAFLADLEANGFIDC
ncbi:PqqD family protein [Altererythrobacter aquiaggeris]|uniref:PqqD family protein n=1 Tax=Aestuarierythrobacter aquiaggeris TaxID=1898396 RepID=UPI00301B2B9A